MKSCRGIVIDPLPLNLHYDRGIKLITEEMTEANPIPFIAPQELTLHEIADIAEAYRNANPRNYGTTERLLKHMAYMYGVLDQYDELQERVEDLEGDVESSDGEIRSLEEEIDELTDANRDLANAKDEIEGEAEMLRGRVAELEAELKELRSK